MANRAYLYFTNDVSALTYENYYKRRDGSEREYLDSRHQVPLAWFLFFEAASVRLEEYQVGTFNYHDLYLCREWARARSDFVRRAPLFLSWFEGEYGQQDVDDFLSQLDSLSPDGPFLVLDPHEFEFRGSGPSLRHDLLALDEELSTIGRFEKINSWSYISPTTEPERRRQTVFGAWYGPPDEGYFSSP